MSAPETAKEHYDAGVAACKKELFAVAEKEYREAISINPCYPAALRDLGFLLYGMFSKPAEALYYLEEARNLNEALEDVDMYVGIVLAELERFDEAEPFFERAISHSSVPGLGHAVYADYLAWRGQATKAEDHFEKAISLNSDLLPAVRDYARLLASEGRDEEADRLFRRALKLDPNDRLTNRHYREFVTLRKESVGKSGESPR